MAFNPENYTRARRAAQRSFRASVARGGYPYLPVLDDILANYELEAEQPLGIVEIPLAAVVGTKTQGRTSAFAGNFMPLLGEKTEFAIKWMTLCQAQEQEGIRDPIQAYEFLNRFYVQEGNKRVSVMKFFDAVQITGNVTRIVPKKTDDPEIELYYEFMAFYALSGVNYLTVSQKGRYAKLQQLLGFAPDHHWSAAQQHLFRSVFHRFQQAFLEQGGAKLPITAGDALLALLGVFPYAAIENYTQAAFKQALATMWEEIAVLAQPQAVALSLEPAEGGASLAALLNPFAKKPLQIAFLHEKNAATSGWTYGHEFGRRQLEQAFGERIQTHVFSDIVVGENDDTALQQAIANGCTLIFTTTPKLMECSLQAAIAHPEVRILNCSLNLHHPRIRTYYARIYEAKFLAGVIAGAVADDNKIGYIAAYPTFGSVANINAFALGAQLVNPRAQVFLRWSAAKGRQAEEFFAQKGIAVISSQDTPLPDGNEKKGLYSYDAQRNLHSWARIFWHWGTFYERIVASVLDGSWKNEQPTEGVRAVNYWWGMDSGVADVLCSRAVPRGTKRLMQWLQQELAAGRFLPFEGELFSQTGQVQTPLRHEQLVRMDWLCENVVGEIPTFDQLIEPAKPMVLLQGILGEGGL